MSGFLQPSEDKAEAVTVSSPLPVVKRMGLLSLPPF